MDGRALIGSDRDSPRLLAAALQHAAVRVVVKRPLRAPSVEGPKPTTYYQSRNTRYDVYNPTLVEEMARHARARLRRGESVIGSGDGKNANSGNDEEQGQQKAV